MVPASATGVVVFLLCVAPGTCYELLRNRTLHPREESAFLQISRVLLSGTLLTAAALGLLALISLLAPAVLIDLPSLLTGGMTYAAGNVGKVGLTLLFQLLFASLMAVAINGLRTAPNASVITQGTLWHHMTEKLRRPGQKTYLSVRLKSGGEVQGYYVAASTDLEPSKREIMVGAPLKYRHAGAGKAEPLDAAWGAMVLAGAEIEYLTATMIGEETPASKPLRRQIALLWIARHIFSWWPSTAVMVVVFTTAVYFGNPVVRLVLPSVLF